MYNILIFITLLLESTKYVNCYFVLIDWLKIRIGEFFHHSNNKQNEIQHWLSLGTSSDINTYS